MTNTRIKETERVKMEKDFIVDTEHFVQLVRRDLEKCEKELARLKKVIKESPDYTQEYIRGQISELEESVRCFKTFIAPFEKVIENKKQP